MLYIHIYICYTYVYIYSIYIYICYMLYALYKPPLMMMLSQPHCVTHLKFSKHLLLRMLLPTIFRGYLRPFAARQWDPESGWVVCPKYVGLILHIHHGLHRCPILQGICHVMFQCVPHDPVYIWIQIVPLEPGYTYIKLYKYYINGNPGAISLVDYNMGSPKGPPPASSSHPGTSRVWGKRLVTCDHQTGCFQVSQCSLSGVSLAFRSPDPSRPSPSPALLLCSATLLSALSHRISIIKYHQVSSSSVAQFKSHPQPTSCAPT